jgi:hypothetical protein
MPKWSREQIEDYYYSLYSLFLEDARQNFSHIGKELQINDKSAAKLYRWALNENVLFPPFLRLNTFPNCQEFTYFLRFRDVQPAYENLKDDPRIVYETVCSGAFDLMVMSSEKIDFSMEPGFDSFVISGLRSDHIYNKVERRSMGEYFTEFERLLDKDTFIKADLVFPQRGALKWDDVDFSLFRLLKENFRTKYIDIIRCFKFGKSVFYDHLHNVMDNCIVWTPYFPKSYTNYNEYLVLFKTQHEIQLVEQLERIPVHCPIFKVGEWIFAYVMLERDFLQKIFFNLLSSMKSSGFIEDYKYSIPVSHWKKVWTIQDFLPHHSPHRT